MNRHRLHGSTQGLAHGHTQGHAHGHGPARWQRRGLLATALALLGSGGGWLLAHYAFGAGAGELPHPLEPWLIKLHGLAAFFALFLLGALAAAHIPQGWRQSSRPRHAAQRGTGVALCVLGALLALSGYLLYYFAPEALRPALGWGHAALGLAMAVLALAHGRRRRF